MIYRDLDKTVEVYQLILDQYLALGDDEILVIDYTGFAHDYNLYHMLEWYISHEKSQSNYNFDNKYFNYQRLVELLDKNGIEYISRHINSETINEYFKAMNELDNCSFQRNFETVSKIYIADNVDRKIKARKLKI